MTDITPDKLRMARDYAAWITARDPQRKDARAAAEVIEALPDEWIDADKLREVINGQLSSYPHGTAGHHVAEEIACKLQALFPTPQPRTLADMAPEEREACQWMQARDDVGNRVVITRMNEGDQEVTVLYENGGLYEWPYSIIVPLPDLRGMVWPGEQATEEDVSIIPPKIDTSAGHDDDVDMTPEDVPEPELGQAWLIDYKGTHYEAVYWYSQLHAHWSFTTSREGLTTINSRDATPVSRLIPEGKA